MSWNEPVKTQAGRDQETCPAGNWPGTIVALIEAGHQDDNDSETGKAYVSRKLVLGLEVAPPPAGPSKKDGSPFYFAKMLTFSMAVSSNLYDLVVKLSGKAPGEGTSFDPGMLLGAPVMLEVVHTYGKSRKGAEIVYANIKGVGSYPANWPKPPTLRTPLLWGTWEGKPVPDLAWLPPIFGERAVDIIRESYEAKAGKVPGLTPTLPAQQPAQPQAPVAQYPVPPAPPAQPPVPPAYLTGPATPAPQAWPQLAQGPVPSGPQGWPQPPGTNPPAPTQARSDDRVPF